MKAIVKDTGECINVHQTGYPEYQNSDVTRGEFYEEDELIFPKPKKRYLIVASGESAGIYIKDLTEGEHKLLIEIFNNIASKYIGLTVYPFPEVSEIEQMYNEMELYKYEYSICNIINNFIDNRYVESPVVVKDEIKQTLYMKWVNERYKIKS